MLWVSLYRPNAVLFQMTMYGREEQSSVGVITAADMVNGLELELLGRQISSSRQRQHNMKYAYGITYRRFFVRTGNAVCI